MLAMSSYWLSWQKIAKVYLIQLENKSLQRESILDYIKYFLKGKPRYKVGEKQWERKKDLFGVSANLSKFSPTETGRTMIAAIKSSEI